MSGSRSRILCLYIALPCSFILQAPPYVPVHDPQSRPWKFHVLAAKDPPVPLCCSACLAQRRLRRNADGSCHKRRRSSSRPIAIPWRRLVSALFCPLFHVIRLALGVGLRSTTNCNLGVLLENRIMCETRGRKGFPRWTKIKRTSRCEYSLLPGLSPPISTYSSIQPISLPVLNTCPVSNFSTVQPLRLCLLGFGPRHVLLLSAIYPPAVHLPCHRFPFVVL
jgi:hypothetical protein